MPLADTERWWIPGLVSLELATVPGPNYLQATSVLQRGNGISDDFAWSAHRIQTFYGNRDSNGAG